MFSTRQLLAEQPFFHDLRPAHLDRLASYTRRAVFRAGGRLFNEGGRAERFWVIREGLVRLDTHLPGRPATTVETLGPGALVGWSWMFPPHVWQFSGVAVEPTLTLELEAAGVNRMCREDFEFGYELTRRMAAVVADRLQHTRARLIDMYGKQPA